MELADGETRFWRQPNATMPADFSHALGGLEVMHKLVLTFYCVLVPVSAAGAVEWRWRQRHCQGTNHMSARVSFWILVHALCCLLTQVSNAVMLRTSFDSPASLQQCHWHHKLGAAGYIGAMGAQYMVLLARAGLTLDTSNRWACLVFKVTRLMTVTGMPAMIVLALVTFHGAVFYAHTCTQELVLWLVWTFTVSGFGLSACFLLMFVLPVYRHAKAHVGDLYQADTQAVSRRLRQTARHNLRLSLVQIASTLGFQLSGAVLQSAFRDDQGRPDRGYLRLVNFTGNGCDLVINSVALLLMSSAWQPSALYDLVHGPKGGSSQARTRSKRGVAAAAAGVLSAAGPSMQSTAARASTQATSVAPAAVP